MIVGRSGRLVPLRGFSISGTGRALSRWAERARGSACPGTESFCSSVYTHVARESSSRHLTSNK